MNTEELYSIFRQHPVISTDSRDIPDGCIFFALKGQNFNGNKFAVESLAKGAAYAVVDDPVAYKHDTANEAATTANTDGINRNKATGHNRLILVDDVLTSLQGLANYHRKQLNIPVIAITGTNGKTTTKELITEVLKKKYVVTSTRGNLNNHIGVPLTLLGMTKETQIAVVEMGANHPGEIEVLCKIAEPDYGLITNIGKAHLEGFGSFEGIIRTKSELYDFLRKNSGKCFINMDNELLVRQAAGLEMLTYGTGANAQLHGYPESGPWYLTIKVLFPKGWLYLKSNLIGNYNFENILAAARIGVHFNVDPIEIQKAIEKYVPGNNRSQLMQKRSNKIFMDAYNANPTSMAAALENFIKIDHPSKILILGDMLELGTQAEEEHKKIADLIKKGNFEAVYLVGKYFIEADPGLKARKFESIELLSEYLKSQPPIENSLILVKGSRGMQLEKAAGYL